MTISKFAHDIDLTNDIITKYRMIYYQKIVEFECKIKIPNHYSASTMTNSDVTFENCVDSSYVITCDINGHEYFVDDELTLYYGYCNNSNI